MFLVGMVVVEPPTSWGMQLIDQCHDYPRFLVFTGDALIVRRDQYQFEPHFCKIQVMIAAIA